MNRTIAVSLILFVLAGLCEIGGGYLMWQWLREHRPVALGLVGAAVLVLYGVIPTFQSAHFGRVYAAYGGIFVILSTLWGGGRSSHSRPLGLGGFVYLSGRCRVYHVDAKGKIDSMKKSSERCWEITANVSTPETTKGAKFRMTAR